MTRHMPAALPHPQFLMMRDVSLITTYTPQHIYRLIRRGQFPLPVRIGPNRIGFRAEDIDRWVSERQVIRPANDNHIAPDKGKD
jgi:predicted DNA-binding transcriptional regulator AlpA